MPVTVVVGGQYGSEGKGKMVAHLVSRGDVDCVVRCGGSNAGHTVRIGETLHSFRQLPAAAFLDGPLLVISAGALVDLTVLFDEMTKYEITPGRLFIDRNAAVITEKEKGLEQELGLRERICSTLSGTGIATARKVLRDPQQLLARDIPELRSYVYDTSELINDLLDLGKRILVEGTQGYGLSLHHVDSYPFVTSRDTTAAAFLSEACISPRLVDDIIVVFRTYPIRVAGASGPLADEISWDDLTREANAPSALREFTTVTKMLRRIGRFDWELARRAVRANRPTTIAIHGLDYLGYENRSCQHMSEISEKACSFLTKIEADLNVPVRWVFTGPDMSDIITHTTNTGLLPLCQQRRRRDSIVIA